MWGNEVTLCHNCLQVTLEQGVAPVSSPRDMKYRVGVRRGLVCLMGRRDSLVLVDNPPRDGVSIKTLMVVSPYHHYPH